ncbi:MAG: hypothetical protein INQ03_13690 [Candidatus Heimdallarchaeota archaeon]|nr:hypothetical protein [Candidatus Heimdallarchaeota archaeon]
MRCKTCRNKLRGDICEICDKEIPYRSSLKFLGLSTMLALLIMKILPYFAFPIYLGLFFINIGYNVYLLNEQVM